ncbi:aliphatic sulfonate ABC transporter substrate-binding protein [Cylindrospermopsis raciborskii C04]|uniref:Aliphatic sulfonate ABC transporter substrate-binding protein n=1 Tax=Cylindrospermopsis raciborskii C07 TaxID=2014886 RepID=A0ABX4WRB2_9CYAN|nr:aliphatic sulfonate ABC transporter substrate-binding protein [Cylindrospermopsis raciborskii]PNJ98070.1 aliphatic sulfonate ABC transporter substrate-binding protein [Cylindrospermopsis raciborskii C03]PNJ98822.1 aliphatic sulfonate ABC transporter substrate-binding protein [Cylindrospermopsis raciborskii C04]PNK00818.1 aliphatic sulfonate ABC transporter substrate-binding protein [Cylindrospermopsis raciborskii C07]
MLKTTIFQGLLPSVQTVAKLSAVAMSASLFISGCANETNNSGANTSPTSEASAENKASNTAGALRIGFQKSATVLFSLKGKGTLENVFKEKGKTVTWSEFPAGLPMVEALNSGAIDVAYVGEAPPVFAQAAKGSTVRYVAYDPYGVEAEGIVVHKDSPIRSIADLKGKKLAVQKGANAHYLAVKAIESVGLKITDVQFSFVKPSDARAAFEKKNVDAWSVWDPYLAAIETEGARLLTNAKGLAPNRGYYLSSQEFIDKNTETLNTLLAELKKESEYAKKNPAEIAKFLSPAIGVDAAVLEKAERRRDYGIFPLTEEVIAKQQNIADTFAKLKLIPEPIVVKQAVWQWKEQGQTKTP